MARPTPRGVSEAVTMAVMRIMRFNGVYNILSGTCGGLMVIHGVFN